MNQTSGSPAHSGTWRPATARRMPSAPIPARRSQIQRTRSSVRRDARRRGRPGARSRSRCRDPWRTPSCACRSVFHAGHCRHRVDQVRPIVREPADPRVLAEPGVLAPGELAGPDDGPPARLRPRRPTRRGTRAPDGSPAPARRSHRPAGRAATSSDTSATSPAAHIASTRCSIRRSNDRTVDRQPDLDHARQQVLPLRQLAAYGRPVSSTTSSARTMRRPLAGWMAAAAAGSTAARRACRASAPRLASSRSHLDRIAGSVPGKSKSSTIARM